MGRPCWVGKAVLAWEGRARKAVRVWEGRAGVDRPLRGAMAVQEWHGRGKEGNLVGQGRTCGVIEVGQGDGWTPIRG